MTWRSILPSGGMLSPFYRMAMAILMLSLGSGQAVAQTQPAGLPGVRELIAAGDDAMRSIERDLKFPRNRYYLEEVFLNGEKPGHKPQAAFAWATGIHLSAINAGAQLQPNKYRGLIQPYVEMKEAYWIEKDGVGGYCDSPHPTKPDRYYDDNAWIVLGLIECYRVAGEPKLLEKAKKTADFVLSGEDDKLGGGLYWLESNRNSKNTCSNAPAIVGLVELYKLTGEKKYLESAQRLYGWTRKTLQDGDGLYLDHIMLDGKIDRTKWTYNTALMIRAGCSLYDVTKDEAYLKEAQRVAAASVGKWVRPDGAMRDNSYFAHLLAEALLELSVRDGDGRWSEVAQRAIQFVLVSNKDGQGRYLERWDQSVTKAVNHVTLKNQASAARAYFRLALFLRDRK